MAASSDSAALPRASHPCGAICPSLIFRFRLVAPARDAHTCRVCEDQLVVEGGHWCDGYGLVIRDTFLVNNCVCVRQVSASGYTPPTISNIQYVSPAFGSVREDCQLKLNPPGPVILSELSTS